MTPEELAQERERIAKAVEEARISENLNIERRANNENAAIIAKAAETYKITQAVEDARCKQLAALKGTMTVYQWGIGILFGLLMFISGSLVTSLKYMPQIAINTDKLNTISTTYPKQFEEIRMLLVDSNLKLDRNNESIANMKLAMSQHIASSKSIK